MIVLLSPAKSLDFSPEEKNGLSQTRLMSDTEQLIKILSKKSAKKLQSLMSISSSLAEENERRFKSFDLDHPNEKSKSAILAFDGDVYRGLDKESLTREDLHFAQDHVRILSGLYGLLRPLDQIQPYRLEMGTNLNNRRGKNLYEFWGDRITKLVNADLDGQDSPIIINLASKEYFSAINKKKVNADIININFKEYRDGDHLKFISFNAKKARGMMTNYIIKNRINDPEELKGFNMENYAFAEDMSTELDWLFTR